MIVTANRCHPFPSPGPSCHVEGSVGDEWRGERERGELKNKPTAPSLWLLCRNGRWGAELGKMSLELDERVMLWVKLVWALNTQSIPILKPRRGLTATGLPEKLARGGGK